MKPITMKEYLDQKGIKYFDRGTELNTHCLFGECDKDSQGNEAHLYINAKTGQYQCKKCLSEGNTLTLMKHLGDEQKDYDIAGYEKLVFEPQRAPTRKNEITEKDVDKYHKALPEIIRHYLNSRGINDDIIEKQKLGYGKFYGQDWITLPIRDIDGEILFFKLRRSPDREEGNKYMFYPAGQQAQLYGVQNLKDNNDYLFICEGEFDQMILEREGLPSVTSTGGAGTFKTVWIELLQEVKTIFIAFDNDEAGNIGAEKLANRLRARFPLKEINRVKLPEEKGKDISEYFLAGGIIDGLVETYSEPALGVNTQEHPEIYTDDIITILSETIKEDDTNKVVVFLAMITAFSDDAQINILLNAPSASGKTYIPMQISQLFPEESIMKLQYVSQNAFFHENGEYDKEKNENHIHLDRKIIVFIDQPRAELLARLRPLLSHDEKVMVSKITDKSGKGGNKTKNIVMHGYPTAIFCTACPELDEQEATRFLLLSPETTQEKFHASIKSRILYESDKELARQALANNVGRMILKERIQYIHDAVIDDVIIENYQYLEDYFLKSNPLLHPRDQRDIVRLLCFVKSFALLNIFHRKRVGNNIFAIQRDIDEAINLWKKVSPGQKYGISPYMMELYEKVFLPAYREYNQSNDVAPFGPREMVGVPRKYITKKHREVYGRPLSETRWRQELEPSLENAGLILKELDGRTVILSPSESDTVNNTIL